jgi:hypothetical protein
MDCTSVTAYVGNSAPRRIKVFLLLFLQKKKILALPGDQRDCVGLLPASGTAGCG